MPGSLSVTLWSTARARFCQNSRCDGHIMQRDHAKCYVTMAGNARILLPPRLGAVEPLCSEQVFQGREEDGKGQ